MTSECILCLKEIKTIPIQYPTRNSLCSCIYNIHYECEKSLISQGITTCLLCRSERKHIYSTGKPERHPVHIVRSLNVTLGNKKYTLLLLGSIIVICLSVLFGLGWMINDGITKMNQISSQVSEYATNIHNIAGDLNEREKKRWF